MQEDIIVSQPSTVHIETLVTVTPITPDPPPNQPPVANAGANQVVTLPANPTLKGSATDPDGTIASYLWEQMSGPTGAVITNPSSATTTVTGTAAGNYVYRLTVTDDKGATSTSTTNVQVLPVVVPPVDVPTYQNPYDQATDINTNQLGRGSISTTIFKTGPGSFRSEVRAGDAPISSGWRSEQQYTQTAANPNEGALEYDVYYENWKDVSGDGGGHSVQWHPNTGGGSAIVSLQNYANKFDVVRSIGGTNWHQSGVLRPVIANKWYHMRWEFKWSTGSDGYVRLYMDGETTPYYSFNGKTADGSGQYFKLGQNRWPWSGNTMGVTTVCYYDNLKIYTKS